MSGIIFVLFLLFYILGLVLLAAREFDSGFAVLLIFSIHAIIFLVMFLRSRKTFKMLGISRWKLFVPFLPDYALAKAVGMKKEGLVTVLFEAMILVSAVTAFISFLYYRQWSVIYFGYEGNDFYESIGGPYWIPQYIMIVAIVIMIVATVLLIRSKARISMALKEEIKHRQSLSV